MPSPSEAPPAPYALVACDVLADEIALLAGEHPPWTALRWLEMGLHDRPDDLRRCIQETLTELATRHEITHAVLAYGRCGDGLLGVRAEEIELILPRADDCIALLLGDEKKRAELLRREPGCYFYSPGWIRGRRVPGPDREAYLREHYARRFADDPEMVDELLDADREAFAAYHTAAWLDLTGNAEGEAYCRRCAAERGWKFRALETDDAFLRALLWGPWDDERFLTVTPGNAIGVDRDGALTSVSSPA